MTCIPKYLIFGNDRVYRIMGTPSASDRCTHVAVPKGMILVITILYVYILIALMQRRWWFIQDKISLQSRIGKKIAALLNIHLDYKGRETRSFLLCSLLFIYINIYRKCHTLWNVAPTTTATTTSITTNSTLRQYPAYDLRQSCIVYER